MAFLQSMNISGSGLTAQKFRMDVISQNITNMYTTRTEDGGPYRRKMVVFRSKESESFEDILRGKAARNVAGGVEVTEVVEDMSEFKIVYNPEHPDADERGYVSMPNVDSLKETVDYMEAYRAYEANITALDGLKQMAMKALEIGK